jgi:calcineurin-like phosphoesterase family protein
MEYVLSDAHFDHGNIVDYCDRPFESVEAMNEALVERWNRVVGDGDEVLFLGDLTMEGGFGEFRRWIDRLDGRVHFVVGDHDASVVPLDAVEVYEHLQFEHRGVPFYGVHDPADAPANWRGWVLHGHHHNNWPDDFPFVDPDHRRVNVSVELLGYEPLPIPELVEYLRAFERLGRRPVPGDRPESDA